MTEWRPNYRPSNGTMGDMFRVGPMGCASCTIDHDQGWHTGDGTESCPILMQSLVDHEGPDEWEEHTETRETRCIAWRGPCDCTKGTTYKPPPASWLDATYPRVEVDE